MLPTAPDDVRLLPGYTGVDQDDTEDDDLRSVLWNWASAEFACYPSKAARSRRTLGEWRQRSQLTNREAPPTSAQRADSSS